MRGRKAGGIRSRTRASVDAALYATTTTPSRGTAAKVPAGLFSGSIPLRCPGLPATPSLHLLASPAVQAPGVVESIAEPAPDEARRTTLLAGDRVDPPGRGGTARGIRAHRHAPRHHPLLRRRLLPTPGGGDRGRQGLLREPARPAREGSPRPRRRPPTTRRSPPWCWYPARSSTTARGAISRCGSR